MFAVALVEMGDGLVMAFVVERHDDGAFTSSYRQCPHPPQGRSLSFRRSVCMSSMWPLLKRRLSFQSGVSARATCALP